MNRTVQVDDSYKSRVATLGNLKIIIYVESILPIMITKDAYITNVTYEETPSDTVTDDTTSLLDPTYLQDNNEERFIRLTSATSPLTLNKVYMYYDKKYSDIIIIPNVEFLSLVTGTHLFELRAYIIGGGMAFPQQGLNQLIPATENSDTRIKLPVTNENISVNTKIITLPGMNPSQMLNTNRIEEYVNDKVNLIKGELALSTIIELGTVTDVFTATTNLPLYLLYQASINEYGIEYIGGNINPGTNKLYIRFRF